jgi:hypothetical protein
MVDQLADLFRTTHKVKAHQVVKSRGHHCGDIELAGYLANAAGPVPLVMDLRISHDRMGSSADPSLNGHLKYPNNVFMPAIASTSGRLHSEFVRLLFLQVHRETDRFFAASGVQLVETLEIRCFLTCGRVEIPTFFRVLRGIDRPVIGGTSGWTGVTITKFFTIKSSLFRWLF